MYIQYALCFPPVLPEQLHAQRQSDLENYHFENLRGLTEKLNEA